MSEGLFDVITLYVVREKDTRSLVIATSDRADVDRVAKRGDTVTEFSVPIPRYSLHFGAITQ